MRRDNIIYTVITIILMLSLILGATYAYFASGPNNISNTTGITVTAPEDTVSFVAYSTNPLNLSVSLSDMQTASNVAAKSDTGDIIVKLSSPSGGTVHCSYDIDFVWDSTDQYTTPSMTLNQDYSYELSLSAVQSISGDTSGHQYVNKNVNENNLTSFIWSGNAGTIGRKATIVSGAEIYSNSIADTTATWTFTINFYSLPESQTGISGKTYAAHLEATNVLC